MATMSRSYALPAALAALALGCASVTLACGTTSPHQTIVELDPMRFEAVEGARDGERVVETLDAETLYKEANAAFHAERMDDAARKFLLLAERFPDSRFALVSLYNGGLALERSERPGEAIAHYEAVAAATAGSKDAQDAWFRVASCHETLESWAAMLEALNRILAPEFEGIAPVDRVEALARRGYAQHRRGDLALAERDYLEALRLYRRHLDKAAIVTSFHVALAQYQIGELYRELFRSIRFRLPVDRMQRDLEEKANYFLKAQSAYLRSLRLQHREFSTKAGYRLGSLYEVMYDDMLSAEVPPELDRDEVDVYYSELRGRVRPLLEKAVDIYERNLRLGERTGQQGEWIRKTENGLARLREALRADATLEARRQLGEVTE